MKPLLDIIVVNDFAHVRGGADRVALSAATGLADAGHRVTVFAAVGPVDANLANHPGVKVVCLGQTDILRDPQRLRAACHGLWNNRAAGAFQNLLKAHDKTSTIVHVHCYTKALSAAVLIAATKLGFRTVLTLHDYFLGCPNGGFYEYPAMKVCRRTPLSASCLTCRCDSRSQSHKLWRFARTWIQNRVVRLPDRLDCIIALSSLNRETAYTFLPTGAKIATVPNPVDVAHAAPVPVEKNHRFVFVGRLEYYKGPQLLARAAAQLNEPAIFCGEGPAASAVKEIYPPAQVTGWLDAAQLDGELRSARALVFPSLWPETFGLTVLEALARGIPVIAARGTAAEEHVRHGINGLLFDRNSARSLAEMMQQLKDPVFAARLGREAHRTYWCDPFTLARHVAALEELFGSLVLIRRVAA